MTMAHTLRLLLVAELPTNPDLATIEMSMRAIACRLTATEPGSDLHTAAHERLDQLLDLRDRLTATGGGVKVP